MSKINEPCLVPLRYFLVRLEETGNWNLMSFNPKPDHIYATYFCTLDEAVHLCEMTPSTELVYIETHATWDEEPEDEDEEGRRVSVQEDIENAARDSMESDGYMHRSDVLRRCDELHKWLEANPEPAEDQECRAGDKTTWLYLGQANPDTEDGKEAIEGMKEMVQCNSML